MLNIDKYDWLWVDAASINQAASNEKDDQVSRMNSIFSSAACVYVWLGEQIEDGGFHPTCYPSSEWHPIGLPYAKSKELLRRGDEVWWRRLWVIQEIVSASNVLVCVGSSVVRWEHFATVLTNNIGPPEAQQAYFPRGWGTAMQILRALHLLREALRSKPDGQDILDLLRSTSLSGTSFPHDRVYSLLGLATAGDRKGIPIIYSAPLFQVFASVVAHVARTKDSLDILVDQWPRGNGVRKPTEIESRRLAGPHNPGTAHENLTRLRNDDQSLPTWVPDFSMPIRSSPLPLATQRTSSALHGIRPCFEIKGHRLRLAAIRVDIVDHVLRFRGKFTNKPTNGQDARLRAFFKSVLERQLGSGFRSTLIKPNALSTTFKVGSAWLGEDLYQGAVFSTTLGFFGVALQQIQSGDEIVAPLGASVPFILRRLTGLAIEYQLIGECYIDGVMNGELKVPFAQGEIETEEFILV